MIDKELLVKTVIEAISGTDLFLVEAKVGSSNDINIEIDSASGVDIDKNIWQDSSKQME